MSARPTIRQSVGRIIAPVLAAFALAAVTLAATPDAPEPAAGDLEPGMVRCANLIYGDAKTSVCFSSEFLSEMSKQTHIVARPRFSPVKLDADKLYEFPFAVMTGEGAFRLTEEQRTNMRMYLENGGFIVASAGCSSPEWVASFRTEIARVFPELSLAPIDMAHPAFHTVYDIKELDCKKSAKQAHLEGLEIDGKVVLIFSEDGLNDTGKAGGNCCCCGGNEIRNARQINVNLLAYALTH